MSTHAILAIVAAILRFKSTDTLSVEQSVFEARNILAEVEKQTKVR